MHISDEFIWWESHYQRPKMTWLVFYSDKYIMMPKVMWTMECSVSCFGHNTVKPVLWYLFIMVIIKEVSVQQYLLLHLCVDQIGYLLNSLCKHSGASVAISFHPIPSFHSQVFPPPFFFLCFSWYRSQWFILMVCWCRFFQGPWQWLWWVPNYGPPE